MINAVQELTKTNIGAVKKVVLVKSPYMLLYISCRNLINKDLFSLSDPMCTLFVREEEQGYFFEKGRTNMIKDNLDPDFPKTIAINYEKLLGRELCFVVVDVDTKKFSIDEKGSSNMMNDDIIGVVNFTVNELLEQPNLSLAKHIQVRDEKYGMMVIQGERIPPDLQSRIRIKIRGDNIDQLDWFSKSDPFIIISRKVRKQITHPIYMTEAIANQSNPIWSEISLPLAHWCCGDLDEEIIFDCYDYNSTQRKNFIGSFTVTTRALLSFPLPYSFALQKEKGRQRGIRRGKIFVDEIELISENPRYLKYVKKTPVAAQQQKTEQIIQITTEAVDEHPVMIRNTAAPVIVTSPEEGTISISPKQSLVQAQKLELQEQELNELNMN